MKVIKALVERPPPFAGPALMPRLASIMIIQHNKSVDNGSHNIYVVSMNSSQAKRYLSRMGATFSPGKGGHLNGKRPILPQHGGSKEIGKGLWLAILKQLGIEE